MTLKVGINGFGRIGRNVLRALHEQGRTDIEVVAINDLAPSQSLAHLFKYDSVHGRFAGTVKATDNSFDIGRGKISVSAERNMADLNWKGRGVDLVMECTGIFTARDKAAGHLETGAKRVLISAPGAGADKTIVYGVNHELLGGDDVVVSNGSCTTNALAPVAKVLNDTFGINHGFMTTVHAYTGDQPTLDAVHKDAYRGRAAALSMIPTTTGAAKAIGLVLPELAGKLDGKAIRVPTPNVSVVDLTVDVAKATTAEEVNAALRAAADGPMAGIFQCVDDKVVSIDLNHDPHSSSAHMDQTVVMNGTMVRVLSWYDNEWGFSNRMLDNAAQMAKFI